MYIGDVYAIGEFLEIAGIHRREECEAFLDDATVKGNRDDFQSAFAKSFDYDDKRKDPKKIYAMSLRIMIPRDCSEEELVVIVNIFMKSINEQYDHILPYAWQKSVIGNAEYVLILAGQREVYDFPLEVHKVYRRDTYKNKKTHCYCKADHPDAEFFPKGSLFKDKDGNVLKEIRHVSPTKDDALRWHTSNDDSLKTMNHKGFTSFLKYKFKAALCSYLNIPSIFRKKSKLRCEKVQSVAKPIQRAKTIAFNIEVRKIRYRLSQYRGFYLHMREKGFPDEYLENDFHHLSSKITQIFTTKHCRIDDDTAYDFPLKPSKKYYDPKANYPFANWKRIFFKVTEFIHQLLDRFEEKYSEYFKPLESLQEYRERMKKIREFQLN